MSPRWARGCRHGGARRAGERVPDLRPPRGFAQQQCLPRRVDLGPVMHFQNFDIEISSSDCATRFTSAANR